MATTVQATQSQLSSKIRKVNCNCGASQGSQTESAAVGKDNRRTNKHHLHVAAAEAMPVSLALPPKTYKEVLYLQDAAQWLQAIEEEVAACLTFNVWEACKLPAGKQALPSHFIFDRTRDGRFKARLVAGGHQQLQGLDF
jgi:hypothetical protein